MRGKLIKLKQDNPSARFKLESRNVTRETVTTASVGQSGLEQPEEYFVCLEQYEKWRGKPDPNDVVFEEVVPGSGVLQAGVSWFKIQY